MKRAAEKRCEVYGRCSGYQEYVLKCAVMGIGLPRMFFKTFVRAADCKPVTPAIPVESLEIDPEKQSLSYQVRVFMLDNRISAVNSVVRLIAKTLILNRFCQLPDGSDLTYRRYKCVAIFYNGESQSEEQAYSFAIRELLSVIGERFPNASVSSIKLDWSSPEECKLRLEAYGVL